MGNNKLSANDGLTKQFKGCFFSEVDSLLVNTLNFCHEQGELSSLQKQAVVTSVEKKGKDKRFIKN